MCSFNQMERLRRRDAEGNCLEYAKKKTGPARGGRRFGQTEGTIVWRLMHEDFSDKTAAEIAAELGKDENSVRLAMCTIKKRTGREVPYKKKRT